MSDSTREDTMTTFFISSMLHASIAEFSKSTWQFAIHCDCHAVIEV